MLCHELHGSHALRLHVKHNKNHKLPCIHRRGTARGPMFDEGLIWISGRTDSPTAEGRKTAWTQGWSDPQMWT